MTTLVVGARIKYCGRLWKIAAVGHVGERYYWLVRGGGKEVAMVPASTLEAL